MLPQNVGVRELVMPALLVRVQTDPDEPETEHPYAEEVAEEAADALEHGDARPGGGVNDAETEQMLASSSTSSSCRVRVDQSRGSVCLREPTDRGHPAAAGVA